MSLSGAYQASIPSSRSASTTQASKKRYDSANVIPVVIASGAYSDQVIAPSGSMNMAPPPLMRLTISTPRRAANSSLTSLRTDWNRPNTTQGALHAQTRSVGGRLPAPTLSTSTSSSAMFSNGDRATAGNNFQPNARQRSKSSAVNGDASAIVARFGHGAIPQRADNRRRQRRRG